MSDTKTQRTGMVINWRYCTKETLRFEMDGMARQFEHEIATMIKDFGQAGIAVDFRNLGVHTLPVDIAGVPSLKIERACILALCKPEQAEIGDIVIPEAVPLTYNSSRTTIFIYGEETRSRSLLDLHPRSATFQQFAFPGMEWEPRWYWKRIE